ENARGIHAIRVLENRKDFTIEGLRVAAYDSYLTAFTNMIPALIRAYDQMPDSSRLKPELTEQIELLRGWDLRWSATSIPTALAIAWGDEMGRRVNASDARAAGLTTDQYIAQRTSGNLKLVALAAATYKLTADFGSWKTPWGDINRFQRLTGDIVQPFTDDGPSIPVAFTSARWGSLASFGARTYRGSKKIYGTSGNSFVAVVEFGADSVRAIAITAGGQSGNPASKHFNDQAQRYATGNLRPVYFYRNQLVGHTERQYNPGN
ncbi:MAG: penicillin acylase family protein, partial [Gemmatimonadota bacterium]